MDAAIGRVLATIESAGITRSTLVIFVSDNGMNCGHHGIWGKGNGTMPQNMYDTSVKVPCIVAQPGRIPAGVISADLLSGYDMFPTQVEYLGLDYMPARPQPGRSFAGILAGACDAGRDHVVVYDEYGPVRMVRTHDWKYVHRYPDGPHELFDLRGDPGERTNRVDDPSVSGVLTSLRDRLETWFRAFVDPQRDGMNKGVTGCGQVDRSERAPEHTAFAADHTQSTDWDLWLTKPANLDRTATRNA